MSRESFAVARRTLRRNGPVILSYTHSTVAYVSAVMSPEVVDLSEFGRGGGGVRFLFVMIPKLITQFSIRHAFCSLPHSVRSVSFLFVFCL